MKIVNLAAAAVFLVGSATMAGQADAHIAWNGFTLNGLPDNGTTHQGVGLQGLRFQGTALHQDKQRSEPSQHGFDFNSMTVDHVTLPSVDWAKTLPLAQ